MANFNQDIVNSVKLHMAGMDTRGKITLLEELTEQLLSILMQQRQNLKFENNTVYTYEGKPCDSTL